MAYEKHQEDQEYEENNEINQYSKQNNDQVSAILLNKEKYRKRKIQGVQELSFENSRKCNTSAQSDKTVQYQMHTSNGTNSAKSNFSRNKVLDWLKSVQSANTQIEYVNDDPNCELAISNDKERQKSIIRNATSSAPENETDVMCISSDSSEEKNEYRMNSSENKCTSIDDKPWAKINKRSCMDKDDLSNASLNNEDLAEKDARKSNCNSFQLQMVENNQNLKGENHKSKKRKLPKLTSLTDIKLRSVPKYVYSEKNINYNCQNYTLEKIKSRSVQIQDDLLSNIASNIRGTDVKVYDKMSVSDEHLDICNKYDENNKSNFDHKVSHSKQIYEHLQQKEHLFNKNGPSCENIPVFEKKEVECSRNNSDENVSSRTGMYKSLKDYDTHIHNFCDNENAQTFEEEAFSRSESDKTENFERTENANNYDFQIDVTGVRNFQNKENSVCDRTPAIIDNKNDCVLILSGDEIGDGHDSEDKESEVTKHFDDNESEVTRDFEIQNDKKTKVLIDNVKPCTHMVNQIEYSYAFSGNESEGTQSFKDERCENTNSILSNDITINQYCMDDKSEKSHILISSDSDTTHDFQDNKDKETNIDLTIDEFQFTQKYESDKQQRDDYTYTYSEIDPENIKQIEIRRNKIEMSQRLSDFFTLYSNIKDPFYSKIVISSDDDNEDTFIVYDENRTKKNTKEKKNNTTYATHFTNSELNHDLENNACSDGESEKTRSFNESEKTQNFNESENGQSNVITNTVTEDKNYKNVVNDQINSNHTILKNENDCVFILSDCESESTHNFKDNNSESTKDFNDNESVKTHDFENIRSEQTNLLNNDDKTFTFMDDKNENPGTFFDNESVGTHSFKGEIDGNLNTTLTNEKALKHNCTDDESEESHILIDSDSDITHDFEDQKAGNTISFTDNQSKCNKTNEKYKKQIDGCRVHDENETSQAEEDTNLNDITNSFDPEDASTRSFNGSEANNKDEFGKTGMNIFQDEMSTDSFQSSSDIEIIM